MAAAKKVPAKRPAKKPAPPVKVENRGGAGRGQGRKSLSEAEPTLVMSIRLTTGQREKLEILGGAAWLRERIDRAKAE